MERISIVGLVSLALALAGCAQTAGESTGLAFSEGKPAARASQQRTAATKKDGCSEAIQAQQNAAMLGGALGMVGSFGGLGGRGGMVASQVASTAGNMVATSQSANARARVMKECY
ncbi:hypothetical protein [Chelativorans sp. J32]|uniref:hypothetical protein n=1 Tax=Chelativorans sp. J32 TaxID=935840 RepID=UPI000487E150|nr:hypothetical protein [Chelativorans sp. J32]